MLNQAKDTWRRGLVGRSVGNKYRLTTFLGAGRIGYVYRAERSDVPEVTYAVKLTFSELKEGWQTEIQKVARLHSVDGVVHFHDLGTDTITCYNRSELAQYTVWDYISPGRNLKSYLKTIERVSVSFIMAVIEQVLKVLHACNERNVARHGDLHTGNILIGDESFGRLDDTLQPRLPIFVSDFGYGATGAVTTPKDDYDGLAQIFNQMVDYVDYDRASPTDRTVLTQSSAVLRKSLREPLLSERTPPLQLLRTLLLIGRNAQTGNQFSIPNSENTVTATAVQPPDGSNVGQFQVSEMIGDRWDVWKRLFVPTVPARSKILSLDIPTVLTGPRGSGKTMLLRRLSERVSVECGPVTEISGGNFVAFYVNANDFADAFAMYPASPSPLDIGRLTCYANLCVLSEVLGVQSAYVASQQSRPTAALLDLVRGWLVSSSEPTRLLDGENSLERYRTILEEIKWGFPKAQGEVPFSGWGYLSQHRWLPHFFSLLSQCCPWIASRPIFLFVDDYSTPRIRESMQRVLNRLFLQRSPQFLANVATESWSTFISEDSSGKTLEDGDDYQLVDIGEESLFLPESERRTFLNDVFARRLSEDQRISSTKVTLKELLGRSGMTKTEFARRLRNSPADSPSTAVEPVPGGSQRRGRSRPRVLYWGDDVFTSLWSGDTRTMIQLIADVVNQASEAAAPSSNSGLSIPIEPQRQDSVFRNRGGEWLASHERNEPTRREQVSRLLDEARQSDPRFKLSGEYGEHLKAIVESFVAAARTLLQGPVYRIRENGKVREVPRMAFRIEVIDEFRIDGLAREVYRDLVRYGLFIRDSRGKSVRGTFVPRLFLRRLLIPYCALALSKRDSVPLTCAEFRSLLLSPDEFKKSYRLPSSKPRDREQLELSLNDEFESIDSDYDDLVGDEDSVDGDVKMDDASSG